MMVLSRTFLFHKSNVTLAMRTLYLGVEFGGFRLLKDVYNRKPLSICGPWINPQAKKPLMWVVVKIMVPFWALIIIRHLIFRVPKKGP